MPIRRHWKSALALVLTGLAVLVLGVVLLLNSPLAARKGAQVLSEQLGTRVEIDRVSVGLSGTTLTGLRVFEPGAPPGAEPLLVVGAIEADTSLCSLARGRVLPSAVSIRNPAVYLRLTKDGQLATRLPHPPGGGRKGGAVPLPTLRVLGACVGIRQDGKPDAGLSGIDLQLTGGEGALTFAGSIIDPDWGKWDIQGTADPSFSSGSVEIRGLTPLVLSAERVARLPLVDPAPLRENPFKIRVLASLRLTFAPGRGGLSYRAEARVEDGTARVTRDGLSVDRLSGLVRVEDSVVTLTGLSGMTADGTVVADGRITLGKDGTRADLAVAARQLDVTRVPPSWGLSDRVQAGRFSGHAHLLIDLNSEGGIRTSGEGKCVVTGARLLGAAAEGPVELTLRPTGGGFCFGPDSQVQSLSDSGPFTDSWAFSLVRKAVQQLLPHVARKGTKDGGRVRLRFGMRNLDLADLTQRLHVALPFAVAGRVSLRVEVNLPADTPDDLAAYGVIGSVEAPVLRLEGVTFQEVKVRVAFRDGVLHLEELAGILSDPAGATRFTGTAQLGVVPVGGLAARLAVEGFPLGLFARFVPGAEPGLGGVVSGALELAVPAGKLNDVTAWDGKVALRSPCAAAFGWTLQGFDAALTLRSGNATLTHLRGTLEGAQVLGSAAIGLAGDYPFQARLSLTHFDLASAQHLLPAFRPPLPVEGKLTTEAATFGRLRSRRFQLTGAAELKDARVDKLPVERLGFRWVLGPDRVRLSDVNAHFAGGTLTGEAEVPLQGMTLGSASFTLHGLDLKEITGKLSPLRSITADGQVDGTFSARIPVNRRDLAAWATLTSQRMRVRGIAAERVALAAELRTGGVGYRLTGQTLGGSLLLAGYLPLAGTSIQPASATEVPPGQLRLNGIRLEQMAEALGLVRQPSPVSGVASLNMEYQHDPADGWPLSSGRLRLLQVRWGDRELAPLIQADLTLTHDQLRVKDISATLPQGRFRAHALLNLVEPDRSWAEVVLEEIPITALLGPFGPPPDRLDGRVTLVARSLLGREARGEAALFLPRGRFDGLTVVNARTSLRWNIRPTAGRGELTVRELSGQVAGGRVAGRADLVMAPNGTQLDGKVQFSGVEIGAVARAADTLATVGVGRGTGVVEFAGRNVRSINDLTGSMRATLGPSQALRLPVLEDIVPYLGPGRSATTSFNRSEVRARLNRGGVIRVERLALAGSRLSVFADGTVTWPDRLNLAVVASTGDLGMNTSLLERLGMQIPAAVGPVPVGLIVRASKYLSDRTVRLEVTGTARSPQIRVNPVEILSEEAIRFFLGGTPINPLQK